MNLQTLYIENTFLIFCTHNSFHFLLKNQNVQMNAQILLDMNF